jgi:hypothetical protein
VAFTFGFPALLYFFSLSISVFSFLGQLPNPKSTPAITSIRGEARSSQAEGAKKNNSSPASGSRQPFGKIENGIIFNRSLTELELWPIAFAAWCAFPTETAFSQTTTIPPHNHNHTTTHSGPWPFASFP